MPGAFRLDFQWLGTRVATSHEVEPEQFEPGVPLELQPRTHHVDLTMNTAVVRGSLALTRRVALEVELPLRRVATEAAFEDARGRVRSDFTSIHHRNENVSGVGDVGISTRVRLWPGGRGLVGAEADGSTPSRWLLDLVVGVTAPTGGVEDDPFARGELGLEHQHVFFGSGTWNPLLQAEAHRRGRLASFYGWLGGSTALTENNRGYRRGFSGSTGLGLSSNFGFTRISFQGQVEVEHSEPSRWQSRAARNSGRTDLVVALGSAYQLRDDWIVRAQLRLPENVSSSSGTLEPDVVILVGASYSLRR